MKTPRQRAGFALLAVVFLVALVAVALTAVVPSVMTEGRRELEEELVFRGEQYQRAIGLFQRKFNRYPTSIEELLHTNDRSFLRRPWPDPMTTDGEWRLIRLGPSGQLVGSVNEQERPGPLGAPGGQQRQPGRGGALPQSSGGGLSSDPSTLPLVGVASKSPLRSFRLYDDYETYQQWEFVYRSTQPGTVPGVPTGAQPGTPGGGQRGTPGGGQQGRPGQQNPRSGPPNRPRR